MPYDSKKLFDGLTININVKRVNICVSTDLFFV